MTLRKHVTATLAGDRCGVLLRLPAGAHALSAARHGHGWARLVGPDWFPMDVCPACRQSVEEETAVARVRARYQQRGTNGHE